MKTILIFSILCCSCAIALPSLGALTDADLDKIRLIVKDEVKSEINASEKRMKEYINTKNESIDDKFESIEKNFDRQNNIIIAGIGIPLAILAIGATVWGSWRIGGVEKTAPSKKKSRRLPRKSKR